VGSTRDAHATRLIGGSSGFKREARKLAARVRRRDAHRGRVTGPPAAPSAMDGRACRVARSESVLLAVAGVQRYVPRCSKNAGLARVGRRCDPRRRSHDGDSGGGKPIGAQTLGEAYRLARVQPQLDWEACI